MPVSEARRRYQLRWVFKRRWTWLLENGPCKWCGSTANLEVHHLNPADKVTNFVWRWRKERRDAELAKCIVLCRKCHKKETIKQIRNRWGLGPAPEHSAVRYKDGCRCDICRKAHAERWRNWYQRRREKLRAVE